MVKLPSLPKLPKIPLPKLKKEPTPSPFSPDFLASQKKILEKEAERLTSELSRLKVFPQYGSSEDENAKEVEEYEKRLGLRKNVEDELRNTKAALERLEKKSYGLCPKDHEPIELGRLKANPAAFFCASHAAEEGKKKWWQMWRRNS